MNIPINTTRKKIIVLTVTNMAMVRNFKIVCENVEVIANYTVLWVTLRSYQSHSVEW
jgi:hypothetical protein